MSKTHQVSFPLGLNPAEVIPLVEQHFSALGYVPANKSVNKILFKKDGTTTMWARDPLRFPHELEVCATGLALVFAFRYTGLFGGWERSDLPTLDSFATSLVAALQAVAQPSFHANSQPVQVFVQQHAAQPMPQQVVERQVVVVRCKFCQKLAPADLATCQHCGAAKFS